MNKFYKPYVLWLLISAFALTQCKTGKHEKTNVSTSDTLVQMPKPVTSPDTDSLKRSLDEQRRMKRH